LEGGRGSLLDSNKSIGGGLKYLIGGSRRTTGEGRKEKIVIRVGAGDIQQPACCHTGSSWKKGGKKQFIGTHSKMNGRRPQKAGGEPGGEKSIKR